MNKAQELLQGESLGLDLQMQAQEIRKKLGTFLSACKVLNDEEHNRLDAAYVVLYDLGIDEKRNLEMDEKRNDVKDISEGNFDRFSKDHPWGKIVLDIDMSTNVYVYAIVKANIYDLTGRQIIGWDVDHATFYWDQEPFGSGTKVDSATEAEQEASSWCAKARSKYFK